MRSLSASLPRSVRTTLAVALALWLAGTTVAVAGPTVSGLVETKTVNSRQAYSTSGTASFSGTNLAAATLTVPAGRRFVIEHISAIVHGDATNPPMETSMTFPLGTSFQVHWFAATPNGVAASPRWVVSESVTLYADPSSGGTTPFEFRVFLAAPAASGFVMVTASGYLD